MAKPKKHVDKDGRVSWQVRVKRTGPDGVQHRVTETVRTKTQAERRIREIEQAIDDGTWQLARRKNREPTVAEAIHKYLDEVTPVRKRPSTAKPERYRGNALAMRVPFADAKLSDVTPSQISQYRDHRLREVSQDSVRHELNLIKSVYKVAAAEWEGCEDLLNPVTVWIPPIGPRRDRRLKPGEEEALMRAARSFRNAEPPAVLAMALDTGMRLSEMLGMRWERVDLDRGLLLIPGEVSKNTWARSVPLTSWVIEALRELRDHRVRTEGKAAVAPTEEIFRYPVDSWETLWAGSKGVRDKQTGAVLKKGFKGLRERAGCPDLRTHDLRHEATSRLVARMPNLSIVQAITGHKSLAALQRYIHLRTDDLTAARDRYEDSLRKSRKGTSWDAWDRPNTDD